ncbi:hypothetical protein ACF08O_25170 [Streptomyces paradoxus]|uniref:hypothetical protein n=1 Tax=Streptomyces paradoxus TaxID=66375 RepID=UPI0036FCF381
MRAFTGPLGGAEESWRPEWRRAEIGAASTHGNARSLARIHSVTLDLIFRQQTDGPDLVLGTHLHFGSGFALRSPAVPHLPPGRTERRAAIPYGMSAMGTMAARQRPHDPVCPSRLRRAATPPAAVTSGPHV